MEELVMQTCLLMKLSNNGYDKGKALKILNRIGLRIKEIDLELASVLDLQGLGGIYVVSMDLGKAAAKAGLRGKDIIIEINNTNIISMRDVEKALFSQTTDKPVQFLVRRFDAIHSLAYMAIWFN
jgi:S1-C subfamily serine protease